LGIGDWRLEIENWRLEIGCVWRRGLIASCESGGFIDGRAAGKEAAPGPMHEKPMSWPLGPLGVPGAGVIGCRFSAKMALWGTIGWVSGRRGVVFLGK